jgi:uncharacterized protein involved in exopolysaccharide biosynthesis
MTMHVSDILASLYSRWKVLTAIAAVILVAVIVWTWTLPRVYVAQASLLFEEDTVAPLQSGGERKSLMGTQADIIKSEAVAAQVVRDQKLTDDPSVIENWRSATGGTGDPAAWLGTQLLNNLVIEPGVNSNVLLTKYKSNDPVFAALMANSFASTFVTERLRLQIDPAKTYTRWFEEQTGEYRKRLEDAQNRLIAFQREKGMIDDGTINAANMRFGELLRLLANAESGVAGSRGQRQTGASSSAVQDNGVVSSLRSEIAGKQAQMSNMTTVYGPNHPSIVAAREELASLRARLRESQGTALGTVGASDSASSYAAADLRRLVAEQKKKMLALSADRGQMAILQKDVESARAALDNVTERMTAMRLESQVPRGSVRQLDEASPPAFPAEPNVPLRVVLGALFGIMVALTVGVVLEWFRPLVRTSQGVERMTGLPVVTRMSFADSSVGTLMQGATA